MHVGFEIHVLKSQGHGQVAPGQDSMQIVRASFHDTVVDLAYEINLNRCIKLSSQPFYLQNGLKRSYCHR